MSTYAEKLKDPRWQRKSGIYRITISDGIYVGSSILLTKRLRQHRRELLANRHVNSHLQRAFNKYKEIDFDILELVSEPTDLLKREQFYINSLNPRYNIAPFAGSMLGFKHSQNTRKLISKIQVGKKLSAMTRLLMSESRRGGKLTEEHKKKISVSMTGENNPFYKAGRKHPQYGMPKSDETRSRISKTSRANGLNRGSKNRASKTGVLYDAKTGANYLFHSLKPLCSKLRLPYKSICSALHKNRFFADRFYVSHVDLPIGAETLNVRPLEFCSKANHLQ